MIKKIKKFLIISLAACIITLIAVVSLSYVDYLDLKEKEEIQKLISKNTPKIMPEENKYMSFDAMEDGMTVFKEIVYEGLTFDELTTKLNKSLNSTLSNTGNIFAEKSLKYGVNPYLMVAISLHETGCKWTCSNLVKNCNNVGGIKGTPSCNGGSFRSFSTLEEGIDYFISNISRNYYNQGLINADLMEYKYSGGSTTWAMKVNNYMDAIKAK